MLQWIFQRDGNYLMQNSLPTVINSHWGPHSQTPQARISYVRSEPGGEKERQLARKATKIIAARRRGGRRAFDWRTFNERRLNQARTGLFIQNLCETENAGDYEHVGIFILESPKDLERLHEMAPVRIVK